MILLASAGALILAEWFGSTSLNYNQSAWGLTYAWFALLILPGLVTSLLIRESRRWTPGSTSTCRVSTSTTNCSSVLLLPILLDLAAGDDHRPPRSVRLAAPALRVAMGICLSPWGRQQIRPVRELLATGAQAAVGARAARKCRCSISSTRRSGDGADHPPRHRHRHVPRLLPGRAWPRGTLFLLIAASCLSAPGRLLMALVLDADHRVRPALSLAGPAAARPDSPIARRTR